MCLTGSALFLSFSFNQADEVVAKVIKLKVPTKCGLNTDKPAPKHIKLLLPAVPLKFPRRGSHTTSNAPKLPEPLGQAPPAVQSGNRGVRSLKHFFTLGWTQWGQLLTHSYYGWVWRLLFCSTVGVLLAM
jgi:hypothetical protein